MVACHEKNIHIFIKEKLLSDQYNLYSAEYIYHIQAYTVKPVLRGHSKIDKTKILRTHYRLMQVEITAECHRLMQVKGIAECSLGAFCNTFDLH